VLPLLKNPANGKTTVHEVEGLMGKIGFKGT
jgi:hypothetical protein